MLANKIKVFFLFLGDIIVLYAALFLALALRYGMGFYQSFANVNVVPFTVIFIPWLLVFYIAGLYDLRRLRNNLEFLRTLALATTTSGIVAILLFYLVPSFGIAPKTNLFIFIVVFAIIEITWRRLFNRVASRSEAPNKIIMMGETGSAHEIVAMIEANPQLGYEVKVWLKGDGLSAALKETVYGSGANIVVAPRHLKKDTKTAAVLYELLNEGIEIHDLTNFYEQVMGKIPLSDLEEAWFLENLFARNPLYEFAKRIVDVVSGIFLGVFGIILWPFIAISIKLSSPGPVMLKQTRVKKNGKTYVHYKFRTMRETPKKNAWLDEDQSRVTGIGALLRRTHLDELPQVVNLLRGEMSLVGPRPDFVDFFTTLKEKIPYYTIRTIIKPGLTGWSQVNFPKTRSIEETKERLGYDLYYLKNRSFALDFLIILKTAKAALTASGK